MFRRLRTKLTVLYAGLFAIALCLIFPGAYSAAQGDLTANAAAFDRLWLAGVAGLILLGAGSFAIARSVTRPISALDAAAQQLQRGETVTVRVESEDEIGRLAASFNTMAAEIRERERRITRLALRDPDTELPNRLALEQEIEARTAETGGGGVVAIAAFGLDRYAHMRGAIGYAMTAAVIREIGGRLGRLRPDGAIARIAGDVVALAFEVGSLGEATRVAAALRSSLEAPVRLGDNTIDVSLSIGVAAYGLHAENAGQLLDRADIALDQARAARQTLKVFDKAAYGDPAANLSLMSQMLGALSAGEMMLHHQPKLDLRRGEITGVEALVRWRHPTRGLLPPDLFIGMAEETGQIRALTEWVLTQAVAEQAMLIESGYDLAMSINMSGRLLGDPDFAETVMKIAGRANGQLVFEITETAVIDNPQVALQVIDRYAAAGIGVSIDDYGSGLSSLAYLKQIRADELKIDKSFILTMDESQRDALLVKSTIDLAHSLDLKVTAEGVETELALSLLKGMGCDVAQGYLISRPVPIASLLEYLENSTAIRRRAV